MKTTDTPTPLTLPGESEAHLSGYPTPRERIIADVLAEFTPEWEADQRAAVSAMIAHAILNAGVVEQPVADDEALNDALNDALCPFHWQAFLAGVQWERDDWPDNDEDQRELERSIDSVAVGEHYEAWKDDALDKLRTALSTPSPGIDLAEALRDVAAERARQQAVEGWSTAHDDEHVDGELASAAGCYALHAGGRNDLVRARSGPVGAFMPRGWPWDWKWWKPKSARQDLVRAAALIVAEIERLDRADLASIGDGGGRE